VAACLFVYLLRVLDCGCASCKGRTATVKHSQCDDRLVCRSICSYIPDGHHYKRLCLEMNSVFIDDDDDDDEIFGKILI